METFGGSGTAVAVEMVQPMEVVAEEVVTQDEVGAEVELNTAGDSLASQTSISQNMFSKFRKELCCMEDSSEDEGDAVVSSLYLSGQNLADEGNSDVWSGSVKDDCLCWECGERFPSLDQLMSHFRKHEACVRCNLCQVTFRRVVSLSMHLVNVHNNVSLFCTACRLPFDSKWDFNKHLGKHSELSEPPVMPALPSVRIGPREVTEQLQWPAPTSGTDCPAWGGGQGPHV
ncbi:hypothetical protein AAFF_G00126720 [Aldrovandia affinis]|uniref:C2H2-type domain-containing protein n=1 Tax=Aldrovandia affinis TaxID=143900 RepID=A0AAD7W9I1_9TELE|nr:hypothetical protein AAFF_G00126720 [Aldrovandia affinis]